MSAGNSQSFFSMLRPVFFFTAFLFVCFAGVLYVAGNVRGFTERTQVSLLNIIIYSGLFTAFCALLDFIFNMGATIVNRNGHKRVPSFVFLILGLLAFVLSGAAALIMVLTTGNIV
jgi:hypothetical protein